MSRARNIKPGFFTNDQLVELPFEYRLLFIGLWTMADREGRLEDRPVKIKMGVFPGDAVNVDAGLSALHDKGFILRYESAGKRYIQILEFAKHQNPHIKEAKSTIPAPCSHSASTMPAPDIPERATLIPDSGFSDSPFQKITEPEGSVVPAKPGTPNCPQTEIVALYHELLPSLARVRDWTEARQAFLRKRWMESGERQSLDWWRDFFEYVGKSDFLMGRKSSRGGEPFECDLEWLVRPRNFVKVIEGKYENRRAA